MPTTDALNTYADIIVHTGVNIQPGQQLIIGADLSAAPLVRAIARSAYKRGGGTVIPMYSDVEASGDRIAYAHDNVLEQGCPWMADAVARGIEEGAARIAIIGQGDIRYPDGVEPANAGERIQTMSKVGAAQNKRVRELTMSGHSSWCVVAYPTLAWAQQVFPDLAPDAALERLWTEVLHTAYADTTDPLATWEAHNKRLHARANAMNNARFTALHFSGPGTDLTVGLAEGHEWNGGSKATTSGQEYNANIPTEEVFTTPHNMRVDGWVRSTKPLYHANKVIEGIRVRFEGGKVVEAYADTNEDTFLKLLDSDEGARRIGEVALVPHKSPIADTGIVFFETLFDENAACHIALGQAYAYCQTPDPDGRSNEERGANTSRVHVDWMISDEHTVVDGITADGTRVRLIEHGDFVYT